MPVQNSPPARHIKSQSRAQAVLTPIPRVPLDGTPEFSQLRAHLERGPVMEGAALSRKGGRGPKRSISLSGVVGAFPGISRSTLKVPGEDDADTGGPTLAQYNQPVSNHSEPYLLAIMQQITQIMANIQDYSFCEASRPPAFKTPSMKAPAFFEERKKGLHATSFFIGRAEKWIDPYLSNLINKEPAYLLKDWALFESQLLILI
ncbi:hypothetical protein O181_043151 [Austropuccinia psidii MF-1]|uniref:Uncharacterized protein n=1 Tax=Austropuccinia psidii MF-1 TaxID=1389203 RepID=A0A9Q3DMY1_9BASI|nr:hypothetical protein [Austropuccinia psidii MF-1]